MTTTQRILRTFAALLVLVLFVTHIPAPLWVDSIVGFLLGMASQA